MQVEILVVVVCFSIYAIAGLQSLGKLPLPLYVAHRHGSVLVVYLLEKIVLREGKSVSAEAASSLASTPYSMIARRKDVIIRCVREDAYVLVAIVMIISGWATSERVCARNPCCDDAVATVRIRIIIIISRKREKRLLGPCPYSSRCWSWNQGRL